MYDIVYIGNKTEAGWKELSQRYPFSKIAPDFYKAQQTSLTKFFWVVWNDLVVTDNFNFDYTPDEWSHNYIHVFKNGEYYDGICLLHKSLHINSREVKHRFFVNKKEIDIVASTPRQYDIFDVDTYADYQHALASSSTEMFWCIWKNVELLDNTVLDTYFSHHNSYDRSENHVWQNMCNDDVSYHGGIVLASKNKPISKKEVEFRFLINRKETEEIASCYRYPRYIIKNYEQYVDIAKTETSPLFWCIWDNVEVLDESIFDLYFDPTDGRYDADREMHHVWQNMCNDDVSYHGGIVLATTNYIIGKREFIHKFLINRKEHETIASRYRYPRYVIKNYEQYVDIAKTETSPLFWCIWDNVEVLDESIFDLYFDPTDGRYDADRKMHHVFKHIFRGEETYHNGIFLASTAHIIGNREFTHKFVIARKEHDEVISKVRPYDIVFISYNESNADENYNALCKQFPRAKRVHGVKGIHQAHIAAAQQCDTEMFWVVDGDAQILDTFNFSHEVNTYEVDQVHVWQSQNPINSLTYGYGGVKLLPTMLTIKMDVNTADMTTSISNKFCSMEQISNITAFNTDPFSTWRSAFRECCKLASKTIKGQVNEETEKRLDIWCSPVCPTSTSSSPYQEWCISGARAGRKYGLDNSNNPNALRLINNFDWLYEQFSTHTI